MNSAYVYLQLYRLFDNCTPLKVNCGELCGSICCKGDDSGMYLFPGEKEVYKLLNTSRINISRSDFSYRYEDKDYNVPIALCEGNCDRYDRPLACRIFPLTPYINKDGELDVIIDPRAKALCPLAKAFYIEDFEDEFVRRVRLAFVLLMKNKHVRAFMKSYSEYIDDFLKFYK